MVPMEADFLLALVVTTWLACLDCIPARSSLVIACLGPTASSVSIFMKLFDELVALTLGDILSLYPYYLLS